MQSPMAETQKPHICPACRAVARTAALCYLLKLDWPEQQERILESYQEQDLKEKRETKATM